MPGMELDFECECGFSAKNVAVGATEAGHYEVAICFECNILSSCWNNDRKNELESLKCKKCRNSSMKITDPKAWIPDSLHKIFPDSEPWMVEDNEYWEDHDADEELRQLDQIRIICPKCNSYRLRYEIAALWD